MSKHSKLRETVNILITRKEKLLYDFIEFLFYSFICIVIIPMFLLSFVYFFYPMSLIILAFVISCYALDKYLKSKVRPSNSNNTQKRKYVSLWT